MAGVELRDGHGGLRRGEKECVAINGAFVAPEFRDARAHLCHLSTGHGTGDWHLDGAIHTATDSDLRVSAHGHRRSRFLGGICDPGDSENDRGFWIADADDPDLIHRLYPVLLRPAHP